MANEISRRTFVKGLAAGAASLVTLGVLEKVGGGSGTGSSSAGAGSGGASGVSLEELGVEAVASGLTFTPGTYTASAKGIQSDVIVTMTFDETSITNVEIDVSGETADIGARIGGEMAQRILAKQSADVDAVTSATVTSNAIRAAAADCISQASGQKIARPAARRRAQAIGWANPRKSSKAILRKNWTRIF